jgi:hypothetical protein
MRCASCFGGLIRFVTLFRAHLVVCSRNKGTTRIWMYQERVEGFRELRMLVLISFAYMEYFRGGQERSY